MEMPLLSDLEFMESAMPAGASPDDIVDSLLAKVHSME
jgi:hypothetical protein